MGIAKLSISSSATLRIMAFLPRPWSACAGSDEHPYPFVPVSEFARRSAARSRPKARSRLPETVELRSGDAHEDSIDGGRQGTGSPSSRRPLTRWLPRWLTCSHPSPSATLIMARTLIGTPAPSVPSSRSSTLAGSTKAITVLGPVAGSVKGRRCAPSDAHQVVLARHVVAAAALQSPRRPLDPVEQGPQAGTDQQLSSHGADRGRAVITTAAADRFDGPQHMHGNGPGMRGPSVRALGRAT